MYVKVVEGKIPSRFYKKDQIHFWVYTTPNHAKKGDERSQRGLNNNKKVVLFDMQYIYKAKHSDLRLLK